VIQVGKDRSVVWMMMRIVKMDDGLLKMETRTLKYGLGLKCASHLKCIAMKNIM